MKPGKNNSLSIRSRISRYFLGFFSLTGMMFIFQACYGTPQDFGLDVLIEGQVTSASDHEAIRDVEVSVIGLDQYTTTNENGYYSLYCPRQDNYQVSFADLDGDDHGSFLNHDTTIMLDQSEEQVLLNVSLRVQ